MAASLPRSQLSNNRIDAHAFGFGTEVRDKAVAKHAERNSVDVVDAWSKATHVRHFL